MKRVTRVMMITRNVNYSMKIIRALEQYGGFEVRSFTSGYNALEYLRDHPQDAAVVDFLLNDISGEELVRRLRLQNPQIAILVAPYLPAVIAFANQADVQAIIDIPMGARRLIPFLQKAVDERRKLSGSPAIATPSVADATPTEPPAEASPTPATPDDASDDSDQVETAPMEPGSAAQEYVLKDANGSTQLQPAQPALPLTDSDISDESLAIFRRLAAEEPPLPGAAKNPTVSDLIKRLRDRNSAADIVQNFPAQPSSDADADDNKVIDGNTAALILTTILDGSTPVEAFSLADFLQRVAEQMPADRQDILPLPSWVKESVQYTREPDFLDQIVPEYISQTTLQSGGPINITQDPTERILPTQRSAAAAQERVLPPKPDAEPRINMPPPPEMPPLRMDREPEPLVLPAVAAEPAPDMSTATQPPVQPAADPQIGQIALTLTQASLELSAEASVLARNGDILAYAGNLLLEDIEALRDQIADDWEAEPQQARIRFVRLESTGTDYMLYTRATASGFTLSMIFAGTLPLGIIRRQAKRLLEALENLPATDDSHPLPATEPATENNTAAATDTPETSAPAMPPPPPAASFPLPVQPAALPAETLPIHLPTEPIIQAAEGADDLVAMTFVWTLGAALPEFGGQLANDLSLGLTLQLEQSGWNLHALDIRTHYVYLYADAPQRRDGNGHLRDLQALAAAFVLQSQPDLDTEALWADSYLLLLPGRDLTPDEISEFLAFVQV